MRLFGLPVAFLVTCVVSLMTPAPSKEMQDFVDSIRTPGGAVDPSRLVGRNISIWSRAPRGALLFSRVALEWTGRRRSRGIAGYLVELLVFPHPQLFPVAGLLLPVRPLLPELFLPPDSRNYIYRSFRWLTEWIYRPVAYVTPSAIPPILLAPVAAFWVAALRVVLFMVLYQLGLMPRAQAAG